MTMPPSAMTVPQERSMPAVRITSVWPMAMTPDDHHLLQHEREVVAGEEAVALRGEEGAGERAAR